MPMNLTLANIDQAFGAPPPPLTDQQALQDISNGTAQLINGGNPAPSSTGLAKQPLISPSSILRSPWVWALGVAAVIAIAVAVSKKGGA